MPHALPVTPPARRRLRRHVADLLSLGNLLCGLLATAAATQARLDLSLLFVLLGFALDGLDGLAARRWGGTRVGVLADDVADAVTYGLAPAVAVYFTLGGAPGLLFGAAYALCTWTRLLYFTLTKDRARDGCFGGVPSAVAAVLVSCATLLLGAEACYVGAAVGIACALMVAFPVDYLHARRLLRRPGAARKLALGSPLVLAFTCAAGVQGLAGLLLVGALGYGFAPSVAALGAALRGS